MNVKRIFDFAVALAGIVILSPVFLVLSLFVLADTGAPVFFIQRRVGLNGILFPLFKFRTMHPGSDRLGQLTVGDRDKRITRAGHFLRKYKLDELPQLFNVLIGNMSLVGPRPEVKKYVELYSPGQRRILSVKPGITDWASIQYINENELLAHAEDPEKFYVDEIMPSKIRQNLNYIDHHSLWVDTTILFRTLQRVVRH